MINPLRRRSLKACSLILTALMLFALFSALTSINIPQTEGQTQKAIVSATTARAPISINGDFGFRGLNNSTGISWGSGTASDPYIIEGWDIIANSSNGISIKNSRVHFIIRDCYLHDGGSGYGGIYLFNCSNGVLESNTCSNNWDGIALYFCSNNTLSNNTCSNNINSIYLNHSTGNTISDNNSNGNTNNGFYLFESSGNIFNNNNVEESDLTVVIAAIVIVIVVVVVAVLMKKKKTEESEGKAE